MIMPYVLLISIIVLIFTAIVVSIVNYYESKNDIKRLREEFLGKLEYMRNSYCTYKGDNFHYHIESLMRRIIALETRKKLKKDEKEETTQENVG